MRRLFQIFKRNVADDVDAEIDFHLEQRIAEYVAQGITRSNAERRARMRFGDRVRTRHATIAEDELRDRHERRVHLLRDIGSDVRFAVRMLRRQFVPAALAIACIALGIGGTTAVLSVGDALLLRPLPFPNGERLVQITSNNPGGTGGGAQVNSYEDYLDWSAQQRSFTMMAAVSGANFTIGATNPVRAGGAVATASLWRTLGVRAERGRVFTEGDDKPGAARVVVVSHGFAQRTWGSADSAAGKTLTINGRATDVIGVIPDAQRFPEGSELWMPIARAPSQEQRGNRWLTVLGALSPAATLAGARSEMGSIAARVSAQQPEDIRIAGVTLTPLRDRYASASRNSLAIAALAAALVLLIAGSNVACLQLARGSARMRDLSMRLALGASRARLVRQLLVESVVLAAIGGTAGVALGVWGSTFVGRAIASAAPPWMTFTLNVPVLVATTIICVAAGIVFGVVPALSLSRNALGNTLRAGSSGGGPKPARIQRALAVAELALTVVLVTTAALAMESFVRLSRVDTGFNAEHVQTFRLAFTGARYESGAARDAAISAIVDGLQRMPGVAVAAAASHVPVRDCCSRFGVNPPEGSTVSGRLMVAGNIVTPAYFDALRIPIVRGRAFTIDDRDGSDNVVIVNETLASQFWPGVDAVGKAMPFGSGSLRVVGVARDVKQETIFDGPAPQFYRPFAQDPWDAATLVFRTQTGVSLPARAVRAVVHSVDQQTAIGGISALSAIVNRAIEPRRVFGIMFASFAIAGLALALAGVYGVLAFNVTRRRREIGVRMALGADRSAVLRLVLLQATRLAMIGGALGIVGALAAARAMRHSLYGISWESPWRYVAVIALVLLTTLVAALGPAWRASRIDPMKAVRTDS